MGRQVSARIDSTVQQVARIVFMIAVSAKPAQEKLIITSDDKPLEITELLDEHGSRMHSVVAPPGALRVNYEAEVEGYAEPAPVQDIDLIRYLRPSRYCPSDMLVATALAEFSELSGLELLDAVRQWVAGRLNYVVGSSKPTDGAVDTLLAGSGVCRDYAHVTVGLLRALYVPARLVAVYAPGLSPMDFHAVTEAYVDGGWYVIDPTGLAPRQQMVRIATGRDAADTAFMSVVSGYVAFGTVAVSAAGDSTEHGFNDAAHVQLG